MQAYEYDIAILGGGCVGSSIFYELIHRGFKNIALIDNGNKSLSATAHSVGMLRVFHENPDHVDLALQNFSLIKNLQTSNILTDPSKANGSLYFFNKNRYRSYQANLATMEKAQYPFEILTSSLGKKYFPEFVWDKDWAIYEPHGTQLSPSIFSDNLLTASMQKGGRVFNDVEVHRISAQQNHYHLLSSTTSITAKQLILAGGARLLPRLNDLNIALPFEIKIINTFQTKKLNTNYNLPNYFDRETLQFACFTQQEKVLLSHRHLNRIPHQTWENDISENYASDIYAPNRRGFLGKIPGYSDLFIASGWGGTAFKFALAIGKRMANIIEENPHVS